MSLQMSGETVFIGTNLMEAQSLTGDGTGNLYVADWGKCNQVKVFSPDGKLLRATSALKTNTSTQLSPRLTRAKSTSWLARSIHRSTVSMVFPR
jgi:hypothetical protein